MNRHKKGTRSTKLNVTTDRIGFDDVSKPEHFFELALDLLLTLPTDTPQRRVDFVLIQKVEKIALADRGMIKTISTVQTHVGFEGFATKCETRQTVDLLISITVQAFLPADNHEPMVFLKAWWSGFVYRPLAESHRSGRCSVFAMELSNLVRS